MRNKKIEFILLGLALVDSLYLTLIHFLPSALACPDTGIISCQTVLTSSYSLVFGIPLAIIGLAWVLAGLFIFLRFDKRRLIGIWYAGGAAGLVYSISSMAFLGKICIYCLFLDVLIALLVLPF